MRTAQNNGIKCMTNINDKTSAKFAVMMSGMNNFFGERSPEELNDGNKRKKPNKEPLTATTLTTLQPMQAQWLAPIIKVMSTQSLRQHNMATWTLEESKMSLKSNCRMTKIKTCLSCPQRTTIPLMTLGTMSHL